MIEGMQKQDARGEFEEGDIDVVALWTTFDLPRVIAGFLAGVFAGIIAWAFGGLIAQSSGSEFWFPWKIAAAPLLGSEATDFGFNLLPIAVGFIIHGLISGVLGAVYGHFTKTNRISALLAAGFMWGTFSWIFIQNLFTASFLEVRTAAIPSGVAFFVLLVFGFSLSSIRVFDRIIAGRVR